MAPKGQKPKSAAKDKAKNEEQREDPFQAVILTDSYETRFQPFTKPRYGDALTDNSGVEALFSMSTPRCLIPVCETPLIEYTLEFLATSGVYEVIIYTGAHHQQVIDYLQKTKWLEPDGIFRKVTILTSDADSVGAAMRHLDQLHILEGDFLVVSGDVICTVEMEMALRRHKARKAADKNAIMTIMTKELDPGHRSQAKLRTPVFVTDPNTQRILQYEEIKKGQQSRNIMIDQDILKSFNEIEIRQDLVDCRIDICTPDALALWTDSFDWEDPRKHFLHGTLKDYELNGKKIYFDCFDEGYTARVSSLEAYDAVSRDILEGWAFPITPESNIAPSSHFIHVKKLIYMETPKLLKPTSYLEGPLMIGRDSPIGQNSRLRECVIGRRCQVGNDVTIDGAYIWDDVTIGRKARIGKCIIGKGAQIGNNCVIEDGALIAPRAYLPEGSVARGHEIVSNDVREQTSSVPGFRQRKDSVVPEESDQDSDNASDIESKYLLPHHPSLRERHPRTIAPSPPSTASPLSSRSISPVPSSSSTPGLHAPENRLRHDSSFGTSPSSFAGSAAGGSGEDFVRLATNDLYEHFSKNTSYDNVRTEFLSLRMGRNATEAEIRRALVGALCHWLKDMVFPTTADHKAVPEKVAAKQILLKYGNLIKSQAIFDYQSAKRVDQADFLLSLQKECLRRGLGGSMMLAIVTQLYELDILEEEGVLEWWEGTDGVDADKRAVEKGGKGVREQMGKFVEWLGEAEEESSEEDE